VGRKGGIVIVALRQIAPDEEITYDYGRDYLKSFLADGGCRCVRCRGKNRKRALQRRRRQERSKQRARR
jgi:SET domain-containing protein